MTIRVTFSDSILVKDPFCFSKYLGLHYMVPKTGHHLVPRTFRYFRFVYANTTDFLEDNLDAEDRELQKEEVIRLLAPRNHTLLEEYLRVSKLQFELMK